MSIEQFNTTVAEIEKKHGIAVTIRPLRFEAKRLGMLPELWEKIASVRVSLRGWDFPHMPSRSEERVAGDSWVGAWSNFTRHYEAWRFFDSGLLQFRAAVREEEESYQKQIHDHTDFPKDGAFGYDFVQQIFVQTEVFELAHRMAVTFDFQEGLYVEIKYFNTEGTFIGNSDFDRSWYGTEACVYPHIMLPRTLDYVLATTRYRHELLTVHAEWLRHFEKDTVKNSILIDIQDKLYSTGMGRDRAAPPYDWSENDA